MEQSINPAIFKAYDIRGLYPEEINEEAAYRIGRSFVQHLAIKRVVVGRDMRESSPTLFKELSKGICDQGADVIDIGMVTTPELSFAVMKWNEPAGIMISASHNPGKYNAFKLIKNEGGGAMQIHLENGIRDIQKLAVENNFVDSEVKGKIERRDVLPEYKKQILEFAKEVSSMKIVVDYGNGVGSVAAKPVLSELPIEVISLFPEPDGSFPNHEPNPHDVSNFSVLQKKVLEEKADLGIFFDGDADRSQLINEKGEIIFPDVTLGILSQEELKKYPGGKVFYDLRFTKAVGEIIRELGGEAEMLRVGNPFYKEAIIKDGGILAGEFSGHIMFRDHWAIDDGLFSAIKFMAIMKKLGRRASELCEPFRRYYQTEEINLRVANADQVFEKIKEKYSDGELNTLDGLLITYPEWWLSVRKSNTEPLVRLRLEANTKELMEKQRDEVLGVINSKG